MARSVARTVKQFPTASAIGSIDIRRLASLLSIAGLLLAAFLLVRLTGGSPNPLNHLGYLPILMAAWRFGSLAALVTSVIVGALLGPAEILVPLGGTIEGPEAWIVRGSMFLVIGGTVGILMDRLRLAAEGWRVTAVQVAERERDAMVALARGAEAKDADTGDHIVRCQVLARVIAEAAGLSTAEVEDISWSAMLHDVGKLHVPDRILLKPGPLNAEEWAVIRRHPVWGAEILAQGQGFETARRIARWHHENIDGSGYPDGLRGDAIPLEARIVRVADAFDAMVNARPYKPARSPEWAIEELRRHAGQQFDPELVRLFSALVEQDETLRRTDGMRKLASSL